jgi:hypothetical protein
LAPKQQQHTYRLLGSCALVLLGFGATHTWLAPAAAPGLVPGLAAPDEAMAAAQAPQPMTVVDLQPHRQVSSGSLKPDEGPPGTVTLVNLNPEINTWFLLQVHRQDGSQSSYQLENPQPRTQRLALDVAYPAGVVVVEGTAREPCKLFGHGANSPLLQAAQSHLPNAALCEGRLLLLNEVKGHLTRLEAETEFVRTQVRGGETITMFFHHLLEDTHRETGELRAGTHPGAPADVSVTDQSPLPALLDARYRDRVLAPSGLGVALAGRQREVQPGAWYEARDNPGVYISLLEPQWIDAAILSSYKSTVNTLDSVEASSLCYLVAFDLDRFDLGYALGTQHPSVEWSEHIQPQMRDRQLPGPDGIGTRAPLTSTGMISPELAGITVAAFAGGFKRAHGAFKYGPLASVNHGSHYGFVENGVVFSKLQPQLATVFVLDDGSVHMKTWNAADDSLLPRVRHARQNGVPLVEFDERSQSTVPGRWVSEWGPGNWSGSEDMKLRTLRGAAALQRNGSKQFLIYAVFSDATPSAMARVFQAYRSRYALHLDMNALEHSYLALYHRTESQLFVEYLIEGMREVDKTTSGGTVPRFLGYPDNRDFFFVTRRSP